jgi:hypothetical protein
MFYVAKIRELFENQIKVYFKNLTLLRPPGILERPPSLFIINRAIIGFLLTFNALGDHFFSAV